MRATIKWAPPTIGSPAAFYEPQHSIDGGEWTTITKLKDNSITLTYPDGHVYIVRVRAIDAIGRAGQWSEPSDPYPGDAGAPGPCGKPTWVE